MALVNIAGLTPVDDPSYRYKMPRLQGKVEGRGNGIKTVLVNVVEVAQALNRGAPEVTKFFGTELGAQTTYDESIDRAIVNGAHTDQDLLNKMKVYIEKFVLCPTCHLPETHYKIKDGTIAHKCLACGGKNNVDMSHKLTTFILAQHKKAKDAAKKEEAAKAKKDKKEKKEKKDKGEAPGEDGSEKASSPRDDEGKKLKKEKKEKKVKKEKDNGEVNETTEKKKSKKSFFDGPEDCSSDEPDGEEESDAKAIEDGIARLKIWLSNNPDISPTGAGDAASASIARITDELRAIQTVSSLRPVDRVIIFIGSVFTSALITNSEVAKHQKMLCALAPTPNTQRHIIAAMEWFCGSLHKDLAPKFPIVLKVLFDEEIVEEDVFYDWSVDYAKNDYSADDSLITIDTLEALKASAQPFVTWLREADEEGESSEEESD